MEDLLENDSLKDQDTSNASTLLHSLELLQYPTHKVLTPVSTSGLKENENVTGPNFFFHKVAVLNLWADDDASSKCNEV